MLQTVSQLSHHPSGKGFVFLSNVRYYQEEIVINELLERARIIGLWNITNGEFREIYDLTSITVNGHNSVVVFYDVTR